MPLHEPRRRPVAPTPLAEELDIRTCKRGKGFSYHDADGSRIDDTATLERIRGIVIPPAWTDVRISDDPDSTSRRSDVTNAGGSSTGTTPTGPRSVTG